MIKSLLDWKYNGIYGLHETINLFKSEFTRNELYYTILFRYCEYDDSIYQMAGGNKKLLHMLMTKEWLYRMDNFIGCFRNPRDLLCDSKQDVDTAINLLKSDISYASGTIKFTAIIPNDLTKACAKAYSARAKISQPYDMRPYKSIYDDYDIESLDEFMVDDWKERMNKYPELFFNPEFEEIRALIINMIGQYVIINEDYYCGYVELDSKEIYYGSNSWALGGLFEDNALNGHFGEYKGCMMHILFCHAIVFRHTVEIDADDETVVKYLEELLIYLDFKYELCKSDSIKEKLVYYFGDCHSHWHREKIVINEFPDSFIIPSGAIDCMIRTILC